jgi:hypothetical protein
MNAMHIQKQSNSALAKHQVELDYAPAETSPVFTVELLVLIAVSLAPVGMLCFLDLDRPSGKIAEAVWLGFGVVLPCRYAIGGRHRLWAGCVLLICLTLTVMWLLAGLFG